MIRPFRAPQMDDSIVGPLMRSLCSDGGSPNSKDHPSNLKLSMSPLSFPIVNTKKFSLALKTRQNADNSTSPKLATTCRWRFSSDHLHKSIDSSGIGIKENLGLLCQWQGG
jgi:hypothetical protein